MFHFMHLALIFNRLDSFGARKRKRNGLGPFAFWISPLSSLFSTPLLSFLFLFAFYRFISFLVLSRSPTHTFRNIREHHNNSYQVHVCSMIYSHLLASSTSIEDSEGEMKGALKSPGTSLEGEREG